MHPIVFILLREVGKNKFYSSYTIVTVAFVAIGKLVI